MATSGRYQKTWKDHQSFLLLFFKRKKKKSKWKTVRTVWFLFMFKQDKNKTYVYKYVEKALKDMPDW